MAAYAPMAIRLLVAAHASMSANSVRMFAHASDDNQGKVKWLVARELAHLSKLAHVAIVLLANLQCLGLLEML